MSYDLTGGFSKTILPHKWLCVNNKKVDTLASFAT